AWNQRGQSGKVATIDGQRLHLLGSHRFVERGSVGFNGGSQALNRHTLLAAGWRKRKIHVGGCAGRKHNIGLLLGETALGGGNAVRPGGQASDTERTVAPGAYGACQPGG